MPMNIAKRRQDEVVRLVEMAWQPLSSDEIGGQEGELGSVWKEH